MSGKYVIIIAGSVLLFGCLIGIAVLVFGPISGDEFSNNDSYHTRNREPSVHDFDWKIKKRSGNIIQKSSRLNNDSSEFPNKFQILFSKSNNLSHGQPDVIPGQNSNVPPNLVFPNKRINDSSELPKSNDSIQKKILKAELPEAKHHLSTASPQNKKNDQSTDGIQDPMQVLESPDILAKLDSEFTENVSTSIRDVEDLLESSAEPNQDYEDYTNEGYNTSQENHDEATKQHNPFLDFTDFLNRIAGLYSSGLPNLSRLFQFLNETVIKENTSGLLTQLNNLYSRQDVSSTSLGSDLFSGRNKYESSLAAFVFMSFGIFLLNQIHHLVGKGKFEGRSVDFDRHFIEEKSELDILFEAPDTFKDNMTDPADVEAELHESDPTIMRMVSTENESGNMSSSPGTSRGYTNDMSRALLNILNAYTKYPEALECIWSLYCEDLDKTSAKDGLYGIAARINSIGLRLIMQQISSDLTLDVMLRSLLGWDGLPCRKMFPVCQVNEAAMTLQTARYIDNKDEAEHSTTIKMITT